MRRTHVVLVWAVVTVVVLALVLMVLLSPALIAVALVLAAVDGWRLGRLARRTACGECGCVLGPESLRWARAEAAARNGAARRNHPGVKLRRAAGPEAVCVGCGTGYRRAGGRLAPVPAGE